MTDFAKILLLQSLSIRQIVALIWFFTLVIAVPLLCVFAPRIRRLLWLFLLSQIPLTILTFYPAIDRLLGHAATQPPAVYLESLAWFNLTGITLWLAYSAARRYDIIPPFSWRYFRWGRTAIGFLLLIGGQYLTGILIYFLHGAGTGTTSNQASLNSLATQVPLLLFFLATVLAGFFEELLFRVGIFELLLPRHKNWAFLVATILFAGAHVIAGPIWGSFEALQSWIIYGFMALILTGFYYKYRNFYLNMSIHMALNIFASGVFWLQLILH